MDTLFKRKKWHETLGHRKTIHSTKGTRQEVLMNPQEILRGIYERAVASNCGDQLLRN